MVENKTGAGGAIATQDVARSAPDGYTLLNTPVATVANEFLSKAIKYEYGKDIIAVCPQAETANILVVSPALGVKTVADLVKLAKEKPDAVQYATAGRGPRRISPASCSTWPPVSRPFRCTTGAVATP